MAQTAAMATADITNPNLDVFCIVKRPPLISLVTTTEDFSSNIPEDIGALAAIMFLRPELAGHVGFQFFILCPDCQQYTIFTRMLTKQRAGTAIELAEPISMMCASLMQAA
jgi:hypothetical protein